jgi:hypothetical protein
MRVRRSCFAAGLMGLAFLAGLAAQAAEVPAVLGVREKVQTINRITRKRLDTLLPGMMAETGIDMWLIVCNEDDLDPVFRTMIPYDTWCPITQILVFSRRPSDGAVERLNLSRTEMRGLYTDAWDWRAWDNAKKESQWDCLARIVRERDPKVIGINESSVIWAADGLTGSLKTALVAALGPKYAARLRPAEKLAVLWLETLLDEELALYEHVSAVARSLIAETFSDRVITPGVTTTDDLLYHYMQRVADLGLQPYAWPWFRIRARAPEVEAEFGKTETVIRRGDFIQCDAGILYLRYYTDHAEWGYVLRPGESDAPAGFRALMAEGNKLQDAYVASFKAGRTGNEILGAALERAGQAGIPKPRIYSHSVGYYLHEPGPLIGLPWEQKDTGARGSVVLVPNSTFTAELSVTGPVPERNGQEMTMSLEQLVAFTAAGPRFIGGRQTSFYLVK